jgi:hypothetical protein
MSGGGPDMGDGGKPDADFPNCDPQVSKELIPRSSVSRVRSLFSVVVLINAALVEKPR